MITLGIIGVVAAMTLPTLINDIQNRQLQAGFKTAYSIFSQAIMNMRANDGEGLQPYYTQYNGETYINKNEFYEKFYKHSQLKVIGTCHYKDKFYTYNKATQAYTSFSAAPHGSAREDFPDALSNGMCSGVLINSSRIFISFDVNGTKKPNQLGHDIFYFEVASNDKLTPMKMSRLYTEQEVEEFDLHMVAGNPCSVKSQQRGNGVGCAYYAMIDQCPDDTTKGYWESLP